MFPENGSQPRTDELLAMLDIPVVGDHRKLEGRARHAYRTIYQMLRVHGVTPGKTCKTCRNLVYKEGDFQGRFPKCRAYEGARPLRGNPWRMGCETTDWRLYYPACGKYEPREET